MPYETSEWSGYSITAVILVIVAIIMIIVAIVWYEREIAKPVAEQSFTGVTFLFVGGIVLFIIALFVGYSGRSRKTSMINQSHTEVNYMGPHPGYGPPPVYGPDGTPVAPGYAPPGTWRYQQ